MTRAKTPLELAALATAAVPGLKAARLCAPQYVDEIQSVTGLVDTSGNKWTVTCPHDSVGGLDLDAQSGVLERLAKTYDVKRIPFDVPRLQGMTVTPQGDRVLVHQNLGGRAMQEADFNDTALLPASLGKALAALHNLPVKIYTGIELPAYTAVETKERLLALLDEAAAQVLIPANLWNRWEGALEDLSLWRFPTVPIHADLHTQSVIVDRGSVRALTGFASAYVGDPASDIAWILAQASDTFLERFTEAYSAERSFTDLHLLTRAQLLSELAIVKWLVHGIHAEDRSIVEEARSMLTDLSRDLGDDLLVQPFREVPEPVFAEDTSTHGTATETHESPAAAQPHAHDAQTPRRNSSAQELDTAAERPTEKLRLDPYGEVLTD